jgi:two-component system, cell cycle response regulator DivK
MMARTGTPETTRGLVLVVDDHADTRDLYGDFLGAAGYRVISAESAEQALTIADALMVDVAVIDVGLPGMDGFELARKLHAQGRRRPRLLAVTGRSSGDDVRETLFDAYLVKPCLPEKLITAVADLLAKRG